MKKIEKILGVITLIAITFKLLSIAGGGFLLTVSLLSLSLVYFCFGFALFNNIGLREIFKKESYQGISPKRMIGTIGLGFSLPDVLVGILFKFQSWEGYLTYLRVGLFFTLVILLVALIAYSKNKASYYPGIFTRIIIIGGFGLIMLLTPRDTFEKLVHRNNPEYFEKSI